MHTLTYGNTSPTRCGTHAHGTQDREYPGRELTHMNPREVHLQSHIV